MQLNSLKPAVGAVQPRRRVGRGIGTGFGKTAGRGHKGQKSRAGGFHKTGFEGGQMPLQRRLPKRGFVSFKKNQASEQTTTIRLSVLNSLEDGNVDLAVLQKHGIINNRVKHVKLYLSGQINKKIITKNILVTNGAKAAIIAAGGNVE
jgi:large subunit ribosomal protein L15